MFVENLKCLRVGITSDFVVTKICREMMMFSCMVAPCRVAERLHRMEQERRLHSQELRDLQFSSNIITMVVDEMGRACGTSRTGGKCITNFSGKSEGLRPPGSSRCVC